MTILVGQWKTSIVTLAKMAAKSPAAMDSAVRDEALLFLRRVRESFKSGGAKGQWAELRSITLELRKNIGRAGIAGRRSGRGTKPLVVSGGRGLMGSVTFKRLGKFRYVVGVSRSNKKFGLAVMHEMGGFIPVTEKMRAFFRFLLAKGVIHKPWPPPETKMIFIRRRSFMQDTMDEFAKGHEKRVMLRYSANMVS